MTRATTIGAFLALGLSLAPDAAAQAPPRVSDTEAFEPVFAPLPDGIDARVHEYHEPGLVVFAPGTGEHAGFLWRMTSDAQAFAFSRVPRTSPRPPTQAVTEFGYDAYGNVVRVTDGLGTVTLTTYDPDGVVVETRRGAGVAALDYRVRTEYDPNLRPVRVLVDDEGPGSVPGRLFEQRTTYDLLGDVLEEGVRLSPTEWLVTRHAYDPEQQRVLTTLPEGNQVAWEYDDRRLRAAEVRGPGTAAESRRSWSYDGNKNPVVLTLPDGDQVLYRYDGFNRLRETVAPSGSVERRTYDPVGTVTSVERWGRPGGPTPTGNDEAGNVLLARLEHGLDGKRRPVEERLSLFGPGLSPQVAVWRTEYDRMDRPVAKVAPEGQRSTIVYDGLSRTAEVRDRWGTGSSTRTTRPATSSCAARWSGPRSPGCRTTCSRRGSSTTRSAACARRRTARGRRRGSSTTAATRWS